MAKNKLKKLLSLILSAAMILSTFAGLNILAFAKEVYIGDVNGDEKVTAVDARIVLRMSARLETATAIADVTGDGRVTAEDARLILRMAAALENYSLTMNYEAGSQTVINNDDVPSPAPTGSSSAELAIKTPESIITGETFGVILSVNNLEGMRTGHFALKFDPDAVQFVTFYFYAIDEEDVETPEERMRYNATKDVNFANGITTVLDILPGSNDTVSGAFAHTINSKDTEAAIAVVMFKALKSGAAQFSLSGTEWMDEYGFLGDIPEVSATADIGASKLTIDAPESVDVGETFKVTVSAKNSKTLLAGEFDLYYDPSVLSLEGITLADEYGNTLAGNEMVVVFDEDQAENGKIKGALMSVAGCENDEITLAEVTFKALKNADITELRLQGSEWEKGDSDGYCNIAGDTKTVKVWGESVPVEPPEETEKLELNYPSLESGNEFTVGGGKVIEVTVNLKNTYGAWVGNVNIGFSDNLEFIDCESGQEYTEYAMYAGLHPEYNNLISSAFMYADNCEDSEILGYLKLKFRVSEASGTAKLTFTASEYEGTETPEAEVYTLKIVPSECQHSYSVTEKAATCTEAGVKTYTCEYCGETYSETSGSAIGHKEVSVAGKAATCTAKGLTEGKKCSVCGTVTVAQKEIPAIGHKYTQKVIAPTASEKGYTVHTCSVCKGSYESDKKDALGLTVVPEIKVDAANKQFRAAADTKFEDFTKNLKGEKVTVKNKDGKELKAGDLIGTGSTVTVTDKSGKVVFSYTAIVPNDVNGDGKISAVDARAVLRISAELDKVSGVFSTAADSNGDKKIQATDARTILRISAGLEKPKAI